MLGSDGMGQYCHVNSEVPYDPTHPEPELDADRLMLQSAVVLRLGKLMLAAGAGSYRVKSSMAKAASAVGLDRHEATMTELVTSSFIGERFRTEACEVRRVGVNVDRLEALRRIVHDLRAHETVEQLDRKLDEVEGMHALYGAGANAAASGVACSGFCFLNQGGWIECLAVLVAAFVGQLVRRQMLKRSYQHFFTWMVCGVVASAAYMGIVSLLQTTGIAEGNHQGGIISAILFLIPGFPMVTSMLDLVRQDFSSALSRAAYVVVVMASAGMAVWTVTFIFHWEVDATDVAVPTGLVLHVLRCFCSFIAAYGFAMLFNAGVKASLLAAVVGALAGSVVAAMFLPIEGGLPVLPFMVITYALYTRVVWRDLAYLALAAAMFALAWQPYDTWQATVSMLAQNSDFMLVLVIPVLHLYNGEHGPHTRFSKYFFYVFYPAHLWLLALVAYVQAG